MGICGYNLGNHYSSNSSHISTLRVLNISVLVMQYGKILESRIIIDLRWDFTHKAPLVKFGGRRLHVII